MANSDQSASQQGTGREKPRRRSAAVVAIVCALGGAGCTTVALQPGPSSATATVGASVQQVWRVDLEALASLGEAAPLRVPTGTRSPTPVFDRAGDRLAFRSAAHEADHDHEVHQLNVLELQLGQVGIVHEWHDPGHDGTDPYGYPMAYDPMGNPILPERDKTWYPAFVGDSLIASVPEMANPYEIELAHRVALRGDRSEPFGTRGSRAVASPNGDRVFLQTTEGLTEFDAGGRLIASHPGWEPAWAPDGRRFVSLLSPWSERGSSWFTGGYGLGWPSDFVVPSEAVGGIVLHDGASKTILVEEGGAAIWLPDGQRLLFERRGETGETVLAEVDLTGSIVEIGRGSNAAVHPAGHLVLFDGPDGLMGTSTEGIGAWTAPAPVGLEGIRPRFSANGARLVVEVPTRERRAKGHDLLVYDLTAIAEQVDRPSDTVGAPAQTEGDVPEDSPSPDDVSEDVDEDAALDATEHEGTVLHAVGEIDAFGEIEEHELESLMVEEIATVTYAGPDCEPAPEAVCEHMLALAGSEGIDLSDDGFDACVEAVVAERGTMTCPEYTEDAACILAATTFDAILLCDED